MSPRSRAVGAGSVPERTDVYQQLADELRQAIVSGQYQPGDRLPSTLDIMARTGVANLTVRGAYQLLVQEGLVESVSRKGFYVRRPSAMTWQMNLARGGRRGSAAALDGWAADAEAAGLAIREDISVAIEDASVPILGVPAGERLGLPAGSRVLVRRTIRYTGPADSAPSHADSLADEYYPYDLVRDTPLASPSPASPAEILAAAGLKICSQADEIRPRVATAE
ncbi:MAG TPA: GntR family transcriptional regulator, partial [Streptosporangiaceae bacterium]|nr:GntR family transcriptional regulator [Streptosporangiaceae bacterium]